MNFSRWWCGNVRLASKKGELSMTNDFEQIVLRPDAYFEHPSEILAHAEWTHEQKIRALENWKNNVVEMLESDNENMLDTTHQDNESLLTLIKELNTAIRETKQSILKNNYNSRR